MAARCTPIERKAAPDSRSVLLDVFERLFGRYGPQHWWPGETPFEVMVGAVLTQAAAWSNVEKAMANLKAAAALSAAAIRELPQEELARLLFPSGYYNAKARKLKALAEFLERYDDDIEALAAVDDGVLRKELLEVHGIGEETADDILLYAVGKPVFVIDEYTRRVFYRLGVAPERGSYSQYQTLFADNLSADPERFGEYHALIVAHAVRVCKKRQPQCEECCLLDMCPVGENVVSGRGSAS